MRQMLSCSLVQEAYGGKKVVLAGGSQAMFVCKMELRDAVGKQFESREILGHAESILKEYSSI